MQTTAQPIVLSNNQVIVSPQTGDQSVDLKYHAKQSFVLGIMQLIAGILCVIFNSVAIGDTGYGIYGAGPGIWCGAFYIVAGILGLISGQNKKKIIINASLAMNIVSNVFAFCLFIWAAVGVGVDSDPYDYYYDYGNQPVQVGMGSMLLLLSILTFVVSTWLYVLGCMSCCRARPHTTTTVITTLPAGTIVNPGAITLQNMPNTQIVNTTGQPNVAYQPLVAGQQVMIQPQMVQTPVYPQQPMAQAVAYPQPVQMMQPAVNPHQPQMMQPPPYPNQSPAYPNTPAPSGKNESEYEALKK